MQVTPTTLIAKKTVHPRAKKTVHPRAKKTEHPYDFSQNGIREKIDSLITKVRGSVPDNSSSNHMGCLSANQLTKAMESGSFSLAEKGLFKDLLNNFNTVDNAAFGGKADGLIGIYDIFKFKQGDKDYNPTKG